MAAGDGFFAPLRWQAQQQFVDVFKLNNRMHVCIVDKDADGYNLLRVVTPLGQEVYRSDLTRRGIVHVFGVQAEPSRDTNTWKLVCVTFPPDAPYSGERVLWFEDTGIAVDWAQVAG